MSRPVITLLTDFGLADSYVGTMKGVILAICSQAAVVDISHEIVPQAVQQAAYLLSTAVPYFPHGTVHLVVVDPGVGTDRRPVIVRTDRAMYVAPDNGVLTLALAQDPARIAVDITKSQYHLSPVSATFHGRDIFAPAAAHLADGVHPRDMGDPFPVSDLFTLPLSHPTRQGDTAWLGEVLHIDRFGNLITNIPGSLVRAQSKPAGSEVPIPCAGISVNIAGTRIVGLARTFAEADPHLPLAYVGSTGHLEIAIRDGNAAAQLGITVGEPVQVTVTAHPFHRPVIAGRPAASGTARSQDRS